MRSARFATFRKVTWWSLGEQDATTRPSRLLSWMSPAMSCWVPSEHAKGVVVEMMTSASSPIASRTFSTST